MSLRETADVIGQRRQVSAEAVLEQRADLRGYQHHYLHVTCDDIEAEDGLRNATLAVDYLCHFGWRLVSISHVAGTLYATVRRDLVPPQSQGDESDV
jgi:hypothetical protein